MLAKQGRNSQGGEEQRPTVHSACGAACQRHAKKHGASLALAAGASRMASDIWIDGAVEGLPIEEAEPRPARRKSANGCSGLRPKPWAGVTFDTRRRRSTEPSMLNAKQTGPALRAERMDEVVKMVRVQELSRPARGRWRLRPTYSPGRPEELAERQAARHCRCVCSHWKLCQKALRPACAGLRVFTDDRDTAGSRPTPSSKSQRTTCRPGRTFEEEVQRHGLKMQLISLRWWP